MDTTHADQEKDGFMKRMLDVVEKAGNKVPHPVIIPHVVAIYIAWTLLFVAWFLLGLPWGL